MPEALLTVFKLCLLALLYLFFLRVLRAVWTEIDPGRLAPAGGPAPTATNAVRRRRTSTKGPATTLRIVEPPTHAGRTYDLADEVTVGRAAGCAVCLDDTYASQLHARLYRRDGSLYVEDLGSTNGTYLNRARVQTPMIMRTGDRLQIGQTVMEVQ